MAGKKVLIIYAHEEPRSFNAALKNVAVDELTKQGCVVTVSDLDTANFEPRTTRKDIAGSFYDPEHFNYAVEANHAYKDRRLSGDIVAEQQKFPMYCYSVPAILKGWMDRVLCQGFAFDLPGFFDEGLLKEKWAILSLTTGGTAEMYSNTGINTGGDIRRFLWPIQHGTLHFCGCQILAPQVSFTPDTSSQEERTRMVAAWKK